MIIDLEILSVRQFVEGRPSNDLEDCVGSTHFDGGTVMPDGSIAYVYKNLWLRYELNIPRKLKSFLFRADYRVALNGPEFVRGQRFGWSFGGKSEPGEENVFYWDTEHRTSGLIENEMKIPRGPAWFWLTYDFTGQNNCYVKDVALSTLQGETVGSVRAVKDGVWYEGTPHVCRGGAWREGELYVSRGGIWRPGT